MRQHFFIPMVAALFIASSACALVYAPPGTALDKTPSGNYELDASHANVLFNLSHMGFSHYFGRFNKISGTLDFDAKAPENSKLAITIDIASIDTNNTKLQNELKGPDWLDATKYPTATFTSTKIEKLSDHSGKVTGDLTLHGITKPVVLDVTFNGAGTNPLKAVPELGFSASAAIKRSDFGVTQYIPMVGDDVTLTIETEFHYKK